MARKGRILYAILTSFRIENPWKISFGFLIEIKLSVQLMSFGKYVYFCNYRPTNISITPEIFLRLPCTQSTLSGVNHCLFISPKLILPSHELHINGNI